MKTEAPSLPPGVAEAWFHISAGGEVWTSRVCLGAHLLIVLDELAPGSYAEDLADQDAWHEVDGRAVSISLPCGEDPNIEIAMIDDPGFAMPRWEGGYLWHVLSTIRVGKELREMLAASCVDGIGVMARWMRRDDGTWEVKAVDTESDDMKPVTDFHEGESVPPEPPTA